MRGPTAGRAPACRGARPSGGEELGQTMRQRPSGDCHFGPRHDVTNGGSGGWVVVSGVDRSESCRCCGTCSSVAAHSRLCAGTCGRHDTTAALLGLSDGGRRTPPVAVTGGVLVEGAVAAVTTGTPAHWAEGPPQGPPWPRPLEAEDVVVEMVEGAVGRRRERSAINPVNAVNGWALAPLDGAVLLRRGTTLPSSALATLPTGRPRGLLASAAGAAVGVVGDAASDATNVGGGRATGTAGEAAWGRVALKWASLADLGLSVICGERERHFHSRHVLTSVQVDEVGAWLVEAVPLAALQRVSAALMHEADVVAADALASGVLPAAPGRRPSRLQAALDQRIMMVAEATGKRAMAEAEADAGGPPSAAAVPLADSRRGGPVDWEAAVRLATMRTRPADRRGVGAGEGGHGDSSGDGRRLSAQPRRPLAELLVERVTLQETLSRFEAQLESYDGADGEDLAEMLRPAMRELAEQLRLLNAQVVAAGEDATSGREGCVAVDKDGSKASVSGEGSSRASSSSRDGRPRCTSSSGAPNTRQDDDGDVSTDGRNRGGDAASMGSGGSDGSGGLVVVVGTSASNSGGMGTFEGDIDAFFTDDSGSDSDRDYSLATSIHDGSVGRACDVPSAPPPLSYDTSSSDDGGGRRSVPPPRRRRTSAGRGVSAGGGGGGNGGGEPPPMSPLTPEGALYSDFETAPSAALSLLDDADAGVSSDLEIRTEEVRRNRRRRIAASLDQKREEG